MGIKGIYREIGPGERISLCKLAVKTLNEKGRPLRIAIDISIWQFQIQAARGGANPAIRTLFYRLIRLLGHSIQPIFVFDGPNKPAFKRNRRSTTRGGATGDVVSNTIAKRMIQLFGFQSHDAPGEAEAECALLQRRGIVDAVLSEDVDTIMFGCTRTLRNWSAEGVRGAKTPTHVSMYDSAVIQAENPGLDREGMVLVALMSGGDYIPEGVPGCGVKVACEAARGGFGRSLCRIKKSDSGAMAVWKEELLSELRDNKSGFFRVRHKALVIPDEFPSLEVLRYYTHPVVSQEATLERLEKSLPWTNKLDVQGLREFVAETFDWTGKIGAVKFIKVLAPGLLVQKIIQTTSVEDMDTENLVKGISKSRNHFSTDATDELRVSFVPTSVVNIDLDKEPDETLEAFGRSGLALNSDDDMEDLGLEESREAEAGKMRPKKAFDPNQPDLVWIPEVILRFGAPKLVEDWHAKLGSKSTTAQKVSNATRTRKAKTACTQQGAMDIFLTVTKKPTNTTKHIVDSESLGSSCLSAAQSSLGPLQGPNMCLLPSTSTQIPPAAKMMYMARGQPAAPVWKSSKQKNTTNTKKPMAKTGITPQDPLQYSSRKAAVSKPASATSTNPWTIASSQSNRSSDRPFKRANTYPPASNDSPDPPSTPGHACDEQPIYISSSPPDSSPNIEASLNSNRSPTNDKHPRKSPVPAGLYKPGSLSSDSSPVAHSPHEQRSLVARADLTGSIGVRHHRTSPKTTAKDVGTSSAAANARNLASTLSSNGDPSSQSVVDGYQAQSVRGGMSGGKVEPKPNRPKFLNPYSLVDLSDDENNEGDDQHSRRLKPVLSASLNGPLYGKESLEHDPSMRTGVAVDSSMRMSNLELDIAEDFMERSLGIATAATTNTTKLYIPRKSANGFVSDIEVSRDEAGRLMREQRGSGGGAGSRIFRRSDITFVDLTASSP